MANVNVIPDNENGIINFMNAKFIEYDNKLAEHTNKITEQSNKLAEHERINAANKANLVIPKIKLVIGELMMFITGHQPRNPAFENSNQFDKINQRKGIQYTPQRRNDINAIITLLNKKSHPGLVKIKTLDKLYDDRNNLAHFKTANDIKDEIKKLGMYFNTYPDLKDTLKIQKLIIDNIDDIIDIIGNNKMVVVSLPPATSMPLPYYSRRNKN